MTEQPQTIIDRRQITLDNPQSSNDNYSYLIRKENSHNVYEKKNVQPIVINKQQQSGNMHGNRVSLKIKEFQYGDKPATMRRKAKSEARFRNQEQFNLIKQSHKLDKIPIQIIKDKIKQEQFIKTQHNLSIKCSSPHQNISNPEDLAAVSNHQSSFQSENSPRMLLSPSNPFYKSQSNANIQTKPANIFRPKLSIFQRYNYENYQNYNYKNPFVKHKHQSLLGNTVNKCNMYAFPKNQKYQPHKGENKNLEIIFCQTKYQDFVKKANHVIEMENQRIKMKKQQAELSNNVVMMINNKSDSESQCYQSRIKDTTLAHLKQNIAQSQNTYSRQLLNPKNITNWNYSQYNSKTLISQNNLSPVKSNNNLSKMNLLLRKKINSKSTLQNLLQQFNRLQRISEYQEKERQGYVAFKRSPANNVQDFSRTVLLQLVTHKFSFLKILSKAMRNHLFKILFKLDSIDETIKISIHDYLKFCRILILKDAPIQEVSLFIFRILYQNHSEISFAVGKKILEQLRPLNKKKLSEAVQNLFQFFNNQTILKQQIMIKIFTQHPYWVHKIIDLINGQ